MRQTEVTVKVKLESDAELYAKLAEDYRLLAEKIRASGDSETTQAFFKFSETFEEFLKALAFKLDSSSTGAPD